MVIFSIKCGCEALKTSSKTLFRQDVNWPKCDVFFCQNNIVVRIILKASRGIEGVKFLEFNSER